MLRWVVWGTPRSAPFAVWASVTTPMAGRNILVRVSASKAKEPPPYDTCYFSLNYTPLNVIIVL
jgi:hypothetical protein